MDKIQMGSLLGVHLYGYYWHKSYCFIVIARRDLAAKHKGAIGVS
jgi:hypothetical protein